MDYALSVNNAKIMIIQDTQCIPKYMIDAFIAISFIHINVEMK